ncbi:Bardet-Biedl syndrome 1 protein [Irineochytrium annulatum]|nr:Bardet-Biedl syndrome 1 protein [Irineochytrium annulatum]
MEPPGGNRAGNRFSRGIANLFNHRRRTLEGAGRPSNIFAPPATSPDQSRDDLSPSPISDTSSSASPTREMDPRYEPSPLPSRVSLEQPQSPDAELPEGRESLQSLTDAERASRTMERKSVREERSEAPPANPSHRQPTDVALDDSKPVSDRQSQLWLESLHAPLANVHTFTQCMALTSPEGDGEHDLIVADFGETPAWLLGPCGDAPPVKDGSSAVTTGLTSTKSHWTEFSTRIKTFQGHMLTGEAALPDPPTALVAFYPDDLTPRYPALALASGAHLYMYRHRRPFFKFTLPRIDPDPLEREVWENLREAVDLGAIREAGTEARNNLETPNAEESPNTEAMVGAGVEGAEGDAGAADGASGLDPVVLESALMRLRHLREQANVLMTHRSHRLLAIEKSEAEAYVRSRSGTRLCIEPVITCMTRLRRNQIDEEAMSCLVIGSEERIVYIVSPPNYTIIEKFQLSSPIAFLGVFGLYDFEYQIAAACRDGNVYFLTKDTCNRIVQLQVPACGLLYHEKDIVVGCMNNTIYAYQVKGRLRYTIDLPAAIMTMDEVKLESRGFVGYAVSLENGDVRIYSGRILITLISVHEPVVALKFGTFGRDPGAMVMVLKRGGILVRILKRTADLSWGLNSTGPPWQQSVPIPVPRKTKVFLDETNREKENATEIHRSFRRDLMRLRLLVKRAYVKTIKEAKNPMVTAPGGTQIRLETEAPFIIPNESLVRTTQVICLDVNRVGKVKVVVIDASPSKMGITQSPLISSEVEVPLPTTYC